MEPSHLLHLAAQFMHGAVKPHEEVEGLTLAAVIEQLLDAKAPDTPRFAAWYCHEVLLPAGRNEEAIRILNRRIKWQKDALWTRGAFKEAMDVLMDICPQAFSD